MLLMMMLMQQPNTDPAGLLPLLMLSDRSVSALVYYRGFHSIFDVLLHFSLVLAK